MNVYNMNIYHLRLERALTEHGKDLAATDISLSPGFNTSIPFEEAYKLAVEAKFPSASGIAKLPAGQSLSPFLDRIKGFSLALRTSGGNFEHNAAIWTLILALVHNKPFTDQKRLDTLDEIQKFYRILPSFDESNDVYSLPETDLHMALASLFSDVLAFCWSSYKLMSCDTGRNFLQRTSRTAVTRRALEHVRIETSGHVKDYESAVSAARRKLLHSTTASHILAVPSTIVSHSEDRSSAPTSRPTSTNLATTVNVPHWNGVFFGRNDALSQIEAILNPMDAYTRAQHHVDDDKPLSCNIHGIGGVGKSLTAREYAQRHRGSYRWIFWVKAQSQAEFYKSYSAISRQIKLPGVSEVMNPNAMEAIQAWLETTHDRWLLICDGVYIWNEYLDGVQDGDSGDDLLRYWPKSTCSASSMIITTQKAAINFLWPGQIVQLTPFEEAVGIEYLLKRVGADRSITDQDRTSAETIVRHIGALPLYLNGVVGYIQGSKCSLTDYSSKLLKDRRMPKLSVPDRMLGYDRHHDAVFDPALNQLRPDAKDFLFVLAILDPASIPEAMLFRDHGEDSQVFFRTEDKEDLFAQLLDVQLVDRETGVEEPNVTMHISIQHAIRHNLNQDIDAQQQAFDRAFLILERTLPTGSELQKPDEDTWSAIEKYLPHIESLASDYNKAAVSRSSIPRMRLARLFSKFRISSVDRGLVKFGEKFMKKAEDILGESEQHDAVILRANIHIDIGMLTDSIGISRRDDGLKRRKEALRLRKQVFPGRGIGSIINAKEILLQNAIMDLACSYQQFNRFENVTALSDACLRKYRSWGDVHDYPFEYAKYYHAMAFVLVYQRKTAMAVDFARTAARLMKTDGENTLIATIYRFDYAVSLFQDQRHEEAIEEHAIVLKVIKSKYGSSDTLTLQSYLVLGVMNYLIGNLEAAENWLYKVFKHSQIQTDRWSEENLARAKFYLSLVLRKSSAPTTATSAVEYAVFTSAYSRPRSRARNLPGGRTQLADIFLQEAEIVLDKYLDQKCRQRLYHSGYDEELNQALLYDYMAPWGFRVVVSQIPDYEQALAYVRDVHLADLNDELSSG